MNTKETKQYQVIRKGKNVYEPDWLGDQPSFESFPDACQFAWTFAQCHGVDACVVEQGMYADSELESGNFTSLARYKDTSPNGFCTEDGPVIPEI